MECDQQGGQRSLYLPEMEHDACGVGFVAQLDGIASHQVVQDALTMLMNMEHRGACGADPETGDGAGVLIQIPHAFFQDWAASQQIRLPEPGRYAVGMVFYPADAPRRERAARLLDGQIAHWGFRLLGRRQVPARPEVVGEGARAAEPYIEQIFIEPVEQLDADALERRLFVLRRAGSHLVNREVSGIEDDFYFTSLSARTLVYKGQFRTHQLLPYFPDLHDPRVASALAMVHSRFSTNTFPKWRLAQPFRYIAHNGEINTIRGNINWMRAKEAIMESPLFTPEEMKLLLPICDGRHSDSRNLDSVVELLVMSGRSLPQALMMLIPEVWQDNPQMDRDRAAFYEYHATLIEPWDGPAAVCFTNGIQIGACLDRNGLRPARYLVTRDKRLILASETGALPVDQSEVVEKGALKPGRILMADLSQGRIISDETLKQEICTRQPYRQWLETHKVTLESLPNAAPEAVPQPGTSSLLQRQQLFGITSEELKVVLMPMGEGGEEPVGSMGADTPLAVLSVLPQHISNYFRQLFAQVSNPPIDPIRERSVMSLRTWIGGSKNLLAETPEQCKQIAIRGPVLTHAELAKLRHIQHPDYRSKTLRAVFQPDEPLETAIARLCEAAAEAAENQFNILIISDRDAGPGAAPIPMLMAIGAVHHHLIRCNLRFHASLIAETGEAREVHHMATLIGYGALAVNPYLAFESLSALRTSQPRLAEFTEAQLHIHYIKALNKGLLKIFSKMGISTMESYHGAQIFEILGISKTVVDKCFTGSISRIGGLGFEELAAEVRARYALAYPEQPGGEPQLETGGVYQWKTSGEAHLFNPETIHLLQQSTRKGDYQLYKRYSARIDAQMERAITLRSLLEFREAEPVPLEEVEPVESILKRFATGAMSFGSISHEAHSTLAIAMNRIGGKSNCGEGGEDPMRYQPLPNGDSVRSAIKQVASGRFGVTSYYLSEADELQIKIAQGAKPGEGGQLPGHKVDEWIGRTRYATPGVGLISPPPHHDIYSIEDLAQLISDLKHANRRARISVKLVSEAGVGTIAAGVAKAHADHILISGHDGGTGASPLSSIRYAGLPWELGLAEAHQTLVLNNLRSRVTLQADGQIRTGRDIAIATLLGAEEWGVATAALVAEGCIMMRKCHLNTCPVGIATQDPVLRAKFNGTPEHVINFFFFIAEEVREIMAELGFRTFDEMVGRVEMLEMRDVKEHWKAKGIDLSSMLFNPPVPKKVGRRCVTSQDHGLEEALDHKIIELAQDALENKTPVEFKMPIRNVHRTVGAMLSGEVAKRYGSEGLPADTIQIKFNGSAGQSFGAFLASGISLELEGDSNDYVGKGLSGGRAGSSGRRAASGA
ncbi:MAG: glutamate synthase large subunit, partial [Bacteroidia bacterium]|nr:glutamate synthase large subunit [Bacteroidia bacterium]